MVVIYIILGCLLFLSIMMNISLWNLAMKYYTETINLDSNKYFDEYFKSQTKEIFPCTLLLAAKEGAEFQGSVYDFSKYAKTGVVGLTEYFTEVSGKYADMDNEPIGGFIPHQNVHLMKDGSYQWDFRPFMRKDDKNGFEKEY